MLTRKKRWKLTFKNNAPFRSSTSKINNAFIDNAEDLDTVMPMYNLLEYSDTCSMKSGSLWNHYRGKVNVDANEKKNDAGNYRMNNNMTTTSKSLNMRQKEQGTRQIIIVD